MSNCQAVSNFYSNFTPKITNENGFAEADKLTTRTLGVFKNYNDQFVKPFFGFVYEWEFINGIIALEDSCLSSLVFDEVSNPICGMCEGRCVENVLEGTTEAMCLDECWDGSYRVKFTKNAQGDWVDECSECGYACY
jgi:hypothetical protein